VRRTKSQSHCSDKVVTNKSTNERTNEQSQVLHFCALRNSVTFSTVAHFVVRSLPRDIQCVTPLLALTLRHKAHFAFGDSGISRRRPKSANYIFLELCSVRSSVASIFQYFIASFVRSFVSVVRCSFPSFVRLAVDRNERFDSAA